MSILQAIMMGILQGVTEFLPVSSSGHLAIFKHLLRIQENTGILFDIVLHLGTMIAIIVVFRRDIQKLLLELCRMVYDVIANVKLFFYNKKTNEGRRYIKVIHNNYRKFLILIVIATIPTAALGYLLQGMVTQVSSSLIGPGAGFLITGVVLLVSDFVPHGDKIPRNVPYKSAILIGICQGIAVFPGISRLGMTVSAGLLSGFNRKFAVKYSFMMSIPAILGGLVLKLNNLNPESMSWKMAGNYFLGALFAGLTGYVCIKFMLRLVEKKRLRYFAYYCFLIGMVAIICNFV